MIPSVTQLTTYKNPEEFDKFFESLDEGRDIFSSGDRDLAKVFWNQAIIEAQKAINEQSKK